jgi:NAD(P)-dependent dehydrogenase (short-subunit alcohol dehydrogenase family)
MTCTGDPFREKMALVTGVHSGIGANTALCLAGLGAFFAAAGLGGRV